MHREHMPFDRGRRRYRGEATYEPGRSDVDWGHRLAEERERRFRIGDGGRETQRAQPIRSEHPGARYDRRPRFDDEPPDDWNASYGERDLDPRYERDHERAARFDDPGYEDRVERHRSTVDPEEYFGPDPYAGMQRRRYGEYAARQQPQSRYTDRNWPPDEGGHPGAQGDRLFGFPDRGTRGRYAGRGPKDYRRSDDRIREDVCEELAAHDEVDASEITVTVRNGEVHLDGTVESRAMKRQAEACLDDVPGVLEVHNNLRVATHDVAPAPRA